MVDTAKKGPNWINPRGSPEPVAVYSAPEEIIRHMLKEKDAYGIDLGVALYDIYDRDLMEKLGNGPAYGLIKHVLNSDKLIKFSKELKTDGDYSTDARIILSLAMVGFFGDEARLDSAIGAAQAINDPDIWASNQNPINHLGDLAKKLNELKERVNIDLWKEVFDRTLDAIKELATGKGAWFIPVLRIGQTLVDKIRDAEGEMPLASRVIAIRNIRVEIDELLGESPSAGGVSLRH